MVWKFTYLDCSMYQCLTIWGCQIASRCMISTHFLSSHYLLDAWGSSLFGTITNTAVNPPFGGLPNTHSDSLKRLDAGKKARIHEAPKGWEEVHAQPGMWLSKPQSQGWEMAPRLGASWGTQSNSQNAKWAWAPTCNLSLRAWRQGCPRTSWPTRLAILAGLELNETPRFTEKSSKVIPDINLGPPHTWIHMCACVHAYTHTHAQMDKEK